MTDRDFIEGQIMKKAGTLAFLVAILGFGVLLAGCRSTQPKERNQEEVTEIVVLCPNIFSGVIKAIIPEFEKSNPGVKIKTVVYPIRPMLDNILSGKTIGDIFLSVGEVELSGLYEKGLANKETERPIARTSLVVLTMPGNPLGLKSLEDIANPDVKRIAIPDPKFNSGGRAFVETARKKGIFKSIEDRLTFAMGPRSSTMLMEKGKAQVAVTHRKCYLGHAKGNALIEFIAKDLHEPIVCRAVVLSGSDKSGLAETFIKFLASPESQDWFRKANFEKNE
jgi:molybdate transport system substrate-binding protein